MNASEHNTEELRIDKNSQTYHYKALRKPCTGHLRAYNHMPYKSIAVVHLLTCIKFSVRPAKGVLFSGWKPRPIRCQPHHR